MRCLSAHPDESVPQASQSASESQSIYRFWANEQVKHSQIIASHRSSVVKRVNASGVVLALQDTTDLDFHTLKQTSGLGFIHAGTNQGIKVHSCIGVSGTGEPLGMLHQHTWTRSERTGKRGERKKKVTADKESQRWLDTLTLAEHEIDPTVQLIHVADREADIYDLFVLPRRANSDLLIRADHNRRVQHELGYLIPTVEQAPVLGQQQIEVGRNPSQSARTTTLTLRALQVTIEVPKDHKQAKQYQPVTLNALLVEELTPPQSVKPIRWLLPTTLPIDCLEQAWQCVRWYSLRWLIERFHFTLKSGCRIEQLQLETKDRLLNALATYSIVAWRLMWLVHHARLTPDTTCETILQPHEWRLLRRRFEPKNRSKVPLTTRQAVRWIAQLGGFLARKHDGEPGLKTLWRGLGKFHDLLEGAQLATQS